MVRTAALLFGPAKVVGVRCRARLHTAERVTYSGMVWHLRAGTRRNGIYWLLAGHLPLFHAGAHGHQRHVGEMPSHHR